MSKEQVRYFCAQGKVQGVMFRKTLILGARKRNLQAGATNDSEHRNQVAFTLKGPSAEIDAFIKRLQKKEPINDWGAEIENIQELTEGKPLLEHQVTTENLDHLGFRNDVKIFL